MCEVDTACYKMQSVLAVIIYYITISRERVG